MVPLENTIFMSKYNEIEDYKLKNLKCDGLFSFLRWYVFGGWILFPFPHNHITKLVTMSTICNAWKSFLKSNMFI